MKPLSNLKERLLALPSIRVGHEHEARYAAFLKKSAPAKVEIATASVAILHAGSVFPPTAYAEARKAIKNSIGIAKRLREKLADNPAVVVEPNIESSFTRLFENAATGLGSCRAAWEAQLQSKIQAWETIADVIAKLKEGGGAKTMKVQGERLRRAIHLLRAAKANLPLCETDASSVKGNLEELKDSVSKLGLESDFGKFLQASASPDGADMNLLQSEEVSKLIEKHGLQQMFRVRLSS